MLINLYDKIEGEVEKLLLIVLFELVISAVPSNTLWHFIFLIYFHCYSFQTFSDCIFVSQFFFCFGHILGACSCGISEALSF